MSAEMLTVLPQYGGGHTLSRGRALNLSSLGVMVPFLLLHAFLGAVVRQSPTAAGVHAAITLAVCIWAALRWRDVAVACCAAYIVGAEALWRMTGAPVPYEVAKYAVSFIFLIALLRKGTRGVWRPLPLFYFALLLPSAALVFADKDLMSRSVLMRLSFNLSGPLCLCMSVWFCSQLKLQARDIRDICLFLLAPLLAIAIVTIIATQTATDLVFTGESNTITSGGFGPNQVSAALGLGVLIALLFTLNREVRVGAKLIGAALVLLFATQSAMTFSRGGLYSAAIAFLAGVPFLLAERRVRRLLVPLTVVIVIVGVGVISPRLEQFTGGKLGDRFEEVQSTNRGDLMLDDIHIWSEHPILGVGPGMVKNFRDDVSGSGHTEFTRLLAEHGAFGLMALLVLILMSVQTFRASGSRLNQGHRIIFLTWALLSMVHAAMRIAAFGFFFGLAHATFQLIFRPSVEHDASSDMGTLNG